MLYIFPDHQFHTQDIWIWETTTKHIGIYAYEREFLLGYSKLKQTSLEISESLEQLRVLENGYKIKVIETKNKIIGVDTKEDLEKLVEYINKKIYIL